MSCRLQECLRVLIKILTVCLVTHLRRPKPLSLPHLSDRTTLPKSRHSLLPQAILSVPQKDQTCLLHRHHLHYLRIKSLLVLESHPLLQSHVSSPLPFCPSVIQYLGRTLSALLSKCLPLPADTVSQEMKPLPFLRPLLCELQSLRSHMSNALTLQSLKLTHLALRYLIELLLPSLALLATISVLVPRRKTARIPSQALEGRLQTFPAHSQGTQALPCSRCRQERVA